MKKFEYKINGKVYNVEVNSIEDYVADVTVNGASFQIEMQRPAKKEVVVIDAPAAGTVPPIARPKTSGGGIGSIQSPLPGTILDVLCKAGDTVTRGQKVVVLEAMKMENAINSDRDGVVKEVKVSKGDSVLEGADLIVIE